MAASGSDSAWDADAAAVVENIMKVTDAHCDHLSASQEELLASAHCIGTVEETEVFSTPPVTLQDPQGQGQSQRGQAGEGEGEDGIAMYSMPFTQTQPSPPSPASSSSSDSPPRKPQKTRFPAKKVRVGTKIWPPSPPLPPTPAATATPAPTPAVTPAASAIPNPTPAPTPAPTPTPTPTPAATATATATSAASPSPEVDPLTRIVLMVPTAPLPTTRHKTLLELARSRGAF